MFVGGPFQKKIEQKIILFSYDFRNSSDLTPIWPHLNQLKLYYKYILRLKWTLLCEIVTSKTSKFIGNMTNDDSLFTFTGLTISVWIPKTFKWKHQIRNDRITIKKLSSMFNLTTNFWLFAEHVSKTPPFWNSWKPPFFRIFHITALHS